MQKLRLGEIKVMGTKSGKLCLTVSVTPRTVAHHVPPSMEFFRQEYWSGLPFRSPGDLLDLGIKPESPLILNIRN